MATTRTPDRWVECPACGNLVLMREGDVHAEEMLRAECQGPQHAPSRQERL